MAGGRGILAGRRLALGDGREHLEPGWDAVETEQLFSILEREVVPLFYERDSEASARVGSAHPREPGETHAALQQQSHADRLSRATLPSGRRSPLAADRREFRQRPLAVHLVSPPPPELAGDPLGNVEHSAGSDAYVIRAQVYLGEIPAEAVRVQVYAEGSKGSPPECHDMQKDHALSGAAGGFAFVARLPPDRASRSTRPGRPLRPACAHSGRGELHPVVSPLRAPSPLKAGRGLISRQPRRGCRCSPGRTGG